VKVYSGCDGAFRGGIGTGSGNGCNAARRSTVLGGASAVKSGGYH
jgi:hypothetical protein